MGALGGVSVAVAAYYWLSWPRRITPVEESRNVETVAAPLPGTTMRRLIVTQPDQDFDKVKVVVESTTVPELAFGQVLVKMKAVPVVRRVFNCD